MFQSQGLRFLAVGVLVLVMFIPLGFVSEIVEDRARYSRQAIDEVSREWGGAQSLSGPLLVIPVTEDVTYERRRERKDPRTGLALRTEQGHIEYETYEETVTEMRQPVHLYPDTLDIDVTSVTERRTRGIFVVPVYTAQTEMAFAFDSEVAETVLTGDEVLHWEDAALHVYLSDNRALRGEAALTSGGAPLRLEPIAANQREAQGIVAMTGDPREAGPFALSFALNGAQSWKAAAVGRSTRLSMTGDWPDPKFAGDFLPDERSVSEDGFTATWRVPHLARPLPVVSREFPDGVARKTVLMGAEFITPNDFYQKAYRSARYGILFIALTFLTILLMERKAKRPAHPVQYLMVGLAQSIFVLLMVSYAEQIGFGPAYLVAAGSTIGLLTFFGYAALGLGRGALGLFAMLSLIYAVLYLILQSADYALLAGSTLAFAALAATMWITRNEQWSSGQGPRLPGLFRKRQEA